MHPEIGKRFFANINEDMVGEALARNKSYLCLVQTPWSLPTYLNDVIRSFVEWTEETQRYEGAQTLLPIWSPTGTRDPFPAVIDNYSGGSDHIVFIDGGVRVPAVMLICWPDMWYHSSGDTPDKSDSTQLKRVVFLSAASAVCLAGAGPAETEKIIAEVGGRSLARLGQDGVRAERRLREASAADVHSAFKEAQNILTQAFVRESGTLASTRFFVKADKRLEAILQAQLKVIDACRLPLSRALEEAHRARCQKEGLRPKRITLSADEIRLSKVVPVRTEKMTGPPDLMAYYTAIQDKDVRPIFAKVAAVEGEIRNFIDGRRSVLQVRDAVAAEAAFMNVPLPTLEDVGAFIKILEKFGYLKLASR
jgi:hypothetical protein